MMKDSDAIIMSDDTAMNMGSGSGYEVARYRIGFIKCYERIVAADTGIESLALYR